MKRTNWLLVATSVVALAAAPAALAMPDEGDRWLGWVGCWELIVDEESDEPIEGTRRVCIDRAERGAVLSTTVDDREVLRRSVVSDGQSRSVDEGGCYGTERAWWSADGARLLVESDLECTGGTRRQSSGVSLLVSQNRWSDVQVANVDGHREVLVRRYRRVATPASPDTPDLSLATATARQAASAPLDLEDVLEATENLDPAVVETLLLEASLGFQIDSHLLMVLAEEEVPGNVVDLLVALSYPDYFAIGDGSGDAELAPGGQAQFVYAYPAGWYPYWGYGFAPFGWGWYHYPGRPIPGRPGSIYGGKVVNGRGYTRVSARPGTLDRGGLASIFSGGGRRGGGSGGSEAGSSGGSMTSKGAKGSGGSTRKAKPRGSGESGQRR